MYANWIKSYKNITEYIQPIPLKTFIGKVPKNIRGTYYKASPGEFNRYNSEVKHPYDGDGYVSAYKFLDGNVYYQSRFVNTVHRKIENKYNKRLYTGAFGTKGLLPIIKNPANTSLLEWNNKLLVFCESGIPYCLDTITLETKGTLGNFQEGLSIRTTSIELNKLMYKSGIIGDIVGAHPKVIDDRLIIYSIEFGTKSSCITFFEFDKCLRIVDSVKYYVTDPLYFIHDFIVTKDYYVFIQHSLKMNLSKIQKGVVNALEEDPLKDYNIIHAVARPSSGKEHHMKESLPGFITHHVDIKNNKESTKNELDMLSVIYPNIIPWDNMDNIKKAKLYRTRWNISKNSIEQTVAFDRWIEFPIYDQKEYIYALIENDYNPQGSMVQINYNNMKEYKIWNTEKQTFLGEPIVTEENVLVTSYDSKMDRSYLNIFEKDDISKGPIAICILPEPIPIGLHGYWSSKI